jgi:predicted nucleic acid-binding protein
VIVVDSSVWIANIREVDVEPVVKLRSSIRLRDVLVGDVILAEVLQGARTEREAETLALYLRSFRTASMCGIEIAAKAAANYRSLRRRGITVRGTLDVIIATFCIERGHALLQNDRDFLPMAKHLGLKLL